VSVPQTLSAFLFTQGPYDPCSSGYVSINIVYRQRCQNVDIKAILKFGVTLLDFLVKPVKQWANLTVLGVQAHAFQDRV